jgi:hypothetical protein
LKKTDSKLATHCFEVDREENEKMVKIRLTPKPNQNFVKLVLITNTNFSFHGPLIWVSS